MKIYTGTGDRGRTSLFSGERINKADERIEAFGDVDELNSVIGALIAALPSEPSDLIVELQAIQSDLFSIGSWLATTAGSPAAAALEKIDAGRVALLEEAIDKIDGQLPELRGFILPGGHPAAAWAHMARAVCRRSERHTVRLLDDTLDDVSAGQVWVALVYLNRLSDYLFVLARYCNHIQRIADILWKK